MGIFDLNLEPEGQFAIVILKWFSLYFRRRTCTTILLFALTIALSLAVARDRRKQARHAVRVDTWLCEYYYIGSLYI